MNIFERASRMKLRFSTTIGMLSVENLWDLPLVNKTTSKHTKSTSLDEIARNTNQHLRAMGEESFVEDVPNKQKAEIELKLDILKHIIKSKQTDMKAAQTRAENASRRQEIESILAKRKSDALEKLSDEELEAQLNTL